MNLKELKDKVDELWNRADVETKVDRKVYVFDIETQNYYCIDDIIIDGAKDIIIEIDTKDIA